MLRSWGFPVESHLCVRIWLSWLKLLVILAALCGLFLCAGVIPLVGRRMAKAYPEFAHCYLPWLLFAGCLTGTFIGLCAREVGKRLPALS